MAERELKTQIFENLTEYRKYQIENHGQSGVLVDYAKQLPDSLLRIVAHFAVRLEEEKEFLSGPESPSFFTDPKKYIALRREFYEMTDGEMGNLKFRQILSLSLSVRDWMLVRSGEESFERKIQLGYPFDQDLSKDKKSSS